MVMKKSWGNLKRIAKHVGTLFWFVDVGGAIGGGGLLPA